MKYWRAEAYDDYYTPQQMQAGLSPFQRSYAYVLANGLGRGETRDMHLWQHMRENFLAATSAQQHFEAVT